MLYLPLPNGRPGPLLAATALLIMAEVRAQSVLSDDETEGAIVLAPTSVTASRTETELERTCRCSSAIAWRRVPGGGISRHHLRD